MRKKTYAALAAAVLAAGALAGCSSQNTEKGKGTADSEGTEETGETAVPSSEAQEGQAVLSTVGLDIQSVPPTPKID